jgi:nicotinamidase-related amidase
MLRFAQHDARRNIMAERVWERFLTEQDKTHLARSGRKHRIGFGEKPALLLIDLYRWVFGDRPQPLMEAIDEWPGSCGLAAWEAIPHIQSLLSTAREAGIPIAYVTGLDERESGMKGWAQANREASSRELTPEQEERRSRQYDIIDEVAPIDGEVVLRKNSPSAFNGTPLGDHFSHLGIDTLLIAGESTSGCVRASVVEATSKRFRVMVAEECVFDRTESAHAMNLFDMDQKYADVLPLAEIEAYIRSLPTAAGAGE